MTQLDEAGSADAAGTGDAPQGGASAQMFINDIPFGFDLTEDGVTIDGDATIRDALRSPGSGLPRASVLATIADCMAGVPACLATAPRLAVTLDIVVRNVAPRCGDRLDVSGEIVKQGRSTVAGEVRFSDAETKELVALSYVTFMASPRPQDVVPVMVRGMRTTGSMPTPFPEYIGLRLVEPGVAEMDLVPFVMQASQSLQGGAVGLLGEVAAESLASAPVLDLDVRYLSAVRVGPGRATATRFGRDLVRVEVRDIGSNDRLAALIFVRVAAG
jgi:acyl-coenzyme A thioesterase PaaI-like protein